ncbi:hypothetical protein M2352_005273 [Azospirillum fermentarium]|uniref:sulfotransferase domain-containing protein n=1 Tax=Azospirillum fermentarium TaxID=1233114 RepID=UPI0022278228|nr:sulfotransferase domain-containing protein [Azospirillum fermentarium]MCW2249590.1 hypothetical protein [Azospirillum fermentarium]
MTPETPERILPGILWLASYPKSGNTWVRLFLWALESDSDIDLQRMTDPAHGACGRHLLQLNLGIDLAELSRDEVTDLRPLAYRDIARHDGGRPMIFKVHDGYYPTPSGQPLLPPEATAGCVHLVRDPRDVCLSLAAHNGGTVDQTINQMANPDFWTGRTRGYASKSQVPEFRGSWSRHGESWLAAPVRRLTVRYEDMVAAPLDWLGRIAAFCGWPADPKTIAAAVERTAFERLAAKEAETGFIERPDGMERFFRSGRAGQWHTALTPGQISRIEHDHGPLMERLGYAPVTDSGRRASAERR